MTDRQISRVVIEFYTDSEEEHEEKCGEIEQHADYVMCPQDCDMDSCRLVGITYSRLTLDEFDKELNS